MHQKLNVMIFLIYVQKENFWKKKKQLQEKELKPNHYGKTSAIREEFTK